MFGLIDSDFNEAGGGVVIGLGRHFMRSPAGSQRIPCWIFSCMVAILTLMFYGNVHAESSQLGTSGDHEFELPLALRPRRWVF